MGTITGTVTPEDYLAAQRLHRQRAARWSYVLGALAMLAGLGIWFFSDTIVGFVLIGAGAGAILGDATTNYWVLPSRSRKLHRQQKAFAHPFTYSWTGDGIEARGISGQAQRPWSMYHKMREDQHLILLYHSDNLFEMVPKRWFSDPAALAEFVALAHRGIATV